jgi:formylglycine-generating enzyme required for sulfatase activity
MKPSRLCRALLLLVSITSFEHTAWAASESGTQPIDTSHSTRVLGDSKARPVETSPRASVSDACPQGFVRIEPGTFTMGAPDSEKAQFNARGERGHNVTFTRALCLQVTEVTQGQWQAVMGTNPSFFAGCGSNCPVESVSWNDAVAYANRKSRADGLEECYIGSTLVGLECTGYRLPTEAEWEFAARAGTSTATYLGDLIGSPWVESVEQPNLDGIAWWDRNAGGTAHTVGQLSPNGWGLYDMLGNVSEWTGDWWVENYPTKARNPVGATSGQSRVSRGGCWGTGIAIVRAAHRSPKSPTRADACTGFRLAKTASP